MLNTIFMFCVWSRDVCGFFLCCALEVWGCFYAEGVVVHACLSLLSLTGFSGGFVTLWRECGFVWCVGVARGWWGVWGGFVSLLRWSHDTTVIGASDLICPCGFGFCVSCSRFEFVSGCWVGILVLCDLCMLNCLWVV